MLQQKETGTSMNSRQAYVSSKSALDIAEDFLNDGKLNLPTNIDDSNIMFSTMMHPVMFR